jgi:hypothetical protein
MLSTDLGYLSIYFLLANFQQQYYNVAVFSVAVLLPPWLSLFLVFYPPPPLMLEIRPRALHMVGKSAAPESHQALHSIYFMLL